MRIAILSDIHANKYALRSVVEHAAAFSPAAYIFLGDLCGYYPWVVECYDTLRSLNPIGVRGNHDDVLLRLAAQDVDDEFHMSPIVPALQANLAAIRQSRSDILEWLASLPLSTSFARDGWTIEICHGTPCDPLHGRFYPDNDGSFAWFPGAGQMVLMGHTHYPLIRRPPAGGLMVNPGSVGQPRDGDVRASWAMLDTASSSCNIIRTTYDVKAALNDLKQMEWNERYNSSLRKLCPDYRSEDLA